jgi:putative ABC transport system ATP-binding protein
MVPLVKVESLSFAHQQGGHRHQVLSDLTLHLDPGELVVLTGPSGSGKSTLLTIVGGLRSASTGSVEVLGVEVVGANERQLINLRRGIGFIFQQHNLAPALTVAQNIQMGLQLSGGHRSPEAGERIVRIASRVGLADHLGKLPGQLSGGQQQRAGIARALVNEPSLVLADEPTASLDRASGQMVMELFNELASGGSAVVLVTHDKRVIDEADRILSLEDGRLVPPAEAFLKDTSGSLRKLMQIDPERLGRLMSFGHALAQVAIADGTVDALERIAMIDALRARQIFSGSELELVVDLALAQARAWRNTTMHPGDRDALQQAAEAVAMADSVVTDEERAAIRQLLSEELPDS